MKYLTCIILLNINTANLMAENMKPLHVSKNHRFLVHEENTKFFSLVDTAWSLAERLNRKEVETYFQQRKKQKFNTIALVVIDEEINTNAYGEYLFEIEKGKYNPLKPIIKNSKNKYGWWDHLDFIINKAEENDLYVILMPAWGGTVAGEYRNGEPNKMIIFNETNAYKYGNWLSRHLKKHNNIIYMLGGDRSAVDGKKGKNDYRSVFRAMAEGLADGVNGVDKQDGKADYSDILISYHPKKWAPNSSKWFHNDKWLSFNSIEDQPSDQIKSIQYDYNLKPAKPTWIFEGGYEKRGSGKTTYTDWQVRFQGYQTAFAGAFGYTYGSMDVYPFGREKRPPERTWEKSLNSPGANQMQYLLKIMTLWTDKQYLERIPDQTLLDGDTGKMTGWEGFFSSVIQATRAKSGDYAMIYSANGSSFRVKMNILADKKMNAYWFNPRTGKWNVKGKEFSEMKPFMKNIPAGKKTPVKEFNPPGKAADGNDWVLVLK